MRYGGEKCVRQDAATVFARSAEDAGGRRAPAL